MKGIEQNRNNKYSNRDYSINTVKYSSAIVLTKSKALLSGGTFKVKNELSPEAHPSPYLQLPVLSALETAVSAVKHAVVELLAHFRILDFLFLHPFIQ